MAKARPPQAPSSKKRGHRLNAKKQEKLRYRTLFFKSVNSQHKHHHKSNPLNLNAQYTTRGICALDFLRNVPLASENELLRSVTAKISPTAAHRKITHSFRSEEETPFDLLPHQQQHAQPPLQKKTSFFAQMFRKFTRKSKTQQQHQQLQILTLDAKSSSSNSEDLDVHNNDNSNNLSDIQIVKNSDDNDNYSMELENPEVAMNNIANAPPLPPSSSSSSSPSSNVYENLTTEESIAAASRKLVNVTTAADLLNETLKLQDAEVEASHKQFNHPPLPRAPGRRLAAFTESLTIR